MADSNDNKLDSIIVKVCAGLMALLISVGSMSYVDMRQRVTNLEDRVSFLYQDKVSRTEFREEMNQLRQQNDANKSDIITRQENMKSDILARIDLIIPRIVNTPRGE